MQQSGQIMRGMRKWIINGCFILVGLVVLLWFRKEMERQEAETEAMKLEGFTVFCEGEEISALFLEEDMLWVGGRDGVKRLHQETGEVLDYIAEDLELIYAAEIGRAEDGSVWIGHNNGVTVWTAQGERVDYTAPDMTGGRVNTVLVTGEQVYVGTMQGATVFRKEGERWQPVERLNKENGLLSNPVNVLEQSKEALWFGSYLDNQPGGISIKTAQGWQYLTIEEGLAHPYINAILPLEDKVLAACGQLTAGGLNVISKVQENYQVTDTYDMEDGIPGEKVRWLYKDWAGYLWITTESDGLILSKDTELEHPIDGVVLTRESGLSDNEIKRIIESDKYYWLAGRYGLTRIEKTAIRDLLEGGH